MRIALFALTGFGNTVLSALRALQGVQSVIVFTRRERGEFPYYPCEQLGDLCRRYGCEVHEVVQDGFTATYERLVQFDPGLILSATFHLRLPPDIIRMAKFGAVNLHPSLLPKYRGPTPTHWTIIHGERESGVTFHLLRDEFDTGEILLQEKTSIHGMTDGELRKKLAEIAGQVLPHFIDRLRNGNLHPRCQDEARGTYYPRITSGAAISILKTAGLDAGNLLRGLTPYPGIGILD